MAKKVRDVVAEITVTSSNQKFLYQLVEQLSSYDICSDITFVDSAKNKYYDFSNVRDSTDLVYPSFELYKIILEISNNDKLLVHMKEDLLGQAFVSLPSEFDCKLENNIHTIAIDADGTLRLCLRIRGLLTPKIHVLDIFDEELLISTNVVNRIKTDKELLCQKCNHTCYMMSIITEKHSEKVADLVHKEKRYG